MEEIMLRLQIPGFGIIHSVVPTTPAASYSSTVPILSPLPISKVKQNKENVIITDSILIQLGLVLKNSNIALLFRNPV